MAFTIKVAMQKQSRQAAACCGYIAGLVVISVTLVGNARADTPSPPTLTEIIVTAQKRLENIQDVPVSVMALSGQELQDAGVKDIKNLQVLTPG
jgi:iron complex outermembrane receptor protein